jgi:hypothetical protein
MKLLALCLFPLGTVYKVEYQKRCDEMKTLNITMKLLAQCPFLDGAKVIGRLGTVYKIEYSKSCDKMKWLDSLHNKAASPHPKQTN